MGSDCRRPGLRLRGSGGQEEDDLEKRLEALRRHTSPDSPPSIRGSSAPPDFDNATRELQRRVDSDSPTVSELGGQQLEQQKKYECCQTQIKKPIQNKVTL